MVQQVKKQIDLSIIVPFYHGNQYMDPLMLCLQRNICEVPERSIEVILVNDSPNEHIEISKDYFERIDIRLLTHKMNRGIHAARLTGLESARGKYIIFLDQDDELLEHALITQFQTIKDADMVCANAYVELPSKQRKILYPNLFVHRWVKWLWTYIYMGNRIISPGQVMLRKSSIPTFWRNEGYLLKKNGLDDFFLWILLLKSDSKIEINPSIVYRHRYTDVNYSLNYNNMTQSADEMLCFLKDHNILGKCQLICYIRNQYYDRMKRKLAIRTFDLRYIDVIFFRVIHKIACFF